MFWINITYKMKRAATIELYLSFIILLLYKNKYK
jgi:hypothetical protein